MIFRSFAAAATTTGGCVKRGYGQLLCDVPGDNGLGLGSGSGDSGCGGAGAERSAPLVAAEVDARLWRRRLMCCSGLAEIARTKDDIRGNSAGSYWSPCLIAPCIVYSLANAVLLRLLTHHLYRTSPFRRASWCTVAQQQILYTLSLYLTSHLYDRIARVLEYVTRCYYAKLCRWYPPPWYRSLFLPFLAPSCCADLSQLAPSSPALRYILHPVTVYLAMHWLVALVPACAAAAAAYWLMTADGNGGGPAAGDRSFEPNLMLWDRAHFWARTELGRAGAYYLGRPVGVDGVASGAAAGSAPSPETAVAAGTATADATSGAGTRTRKLLKTSSMADSSDNNNNLINGNGSAKHAAVPVRRTRSL